MARLLRSWSKITELESRPTAESMAWGYVPSGNLYVADNTLVRRITPDGTVTTIGVGTGGGFADGTATTARFRNVRSITIDSKGVLYVADMSNHAIRKIVVQ